MMNFNVVKQNQQVTIGIKSLLLIIIFVIGSNFGMFYLLKQMDKNKGEGAAISAQKNKKDQLYLLDKATPYVYDANDFEKKVRKVSRKLGVPPEWLMAVIHSESQFDASITNHKGSGATGLIQWMPKTAKDYNVTVAKLRNMNHIEQLDYVYKYLNDKQKRHGTYESITDLYLAILYPKAIGEDYCYTLYAKPSTAYKMNIGLDKNKDGRVLVQDIDQYLKRKYVTAYMANKSQPNSMYAKVFDVFDTF